MILFLACVALSIICIMKAGGKARSRCLGQRDFLGVSGHSREEGWGYILHGRELASDLRCHV